MKNTKCRLSNLIFDDFSATNSKKFAYYNENTSQKIYMRLLVIGANYSNILKRIKWGYIL